MFHAVDRRVGAEEEETERHPARLPRGSSSVYGQPQSQHARSSGSQAPGMTAAGHVPASDTVDTLIVDLLEWMRASPRPYAEVLEVWRTSCPRFPVWEDANDRGFIARHHGPGRRALVSVSAAGAEHLRKHRQPSPS